MKGMCSKAATYQRMVSLKSDVGAERDSTGSMFLLDV